MKKQIAEDMVKFLAPIRQKIHDILEDTSYLNNVMIDGAKKANEHANKTLEKVRNAMRLNYFNP